MCSCSRIRIYTCEKDTLADAPTVSETNQTAGFQVFCKVFGVPFPVASMNTAQQWTPTVENYPVPQSAHLQIIAPWGRKIGIGKVNPGQAGSTGTMSSPTKVKDNRYASNQTARRIFTETDTSQVLPFCEMDVFYPISSSVDVDSRRCTIYILPMKENTSRTPRLRKYKRQPSSTHCRPLFVLVNNQKVNSNLHSKHVTKQMYIIQHKRLLKSKKQKKSVRSYPTHKFCK